LRRDQRERQEGGKTKARRGIDTEAKKVDVLFRCCRGDLSTTSSSVLQPLGTFVCVLWYMLVLACFARTSFFYEGVCLVCFQSVPDAHGSSMCMCVCVFSRSAAFTVCCKARTCFPFARNRVHALYDALTACVGALMPPLGMR
jgi:hypothetical protein